MRRRVRIQVAKGVGTAFWLRSLTVVAAKNGLAPRQRVGNGHWHFAPTTETNLRSLQPSRPVPRPDSNGGRGLGLSILDAAVDMSLS